MSPEEPVEGRTSSRLPPARVAPEALVRARGDAREGLDWLGRPPAVRATLLYRLVRLLARAVLFGIFRFRIRSEGRSLIPVEGGYILIAAAHRGWMDPFVVLHALPMAPRAWFLGSAASTFSSRWRESLIRRIGGLLPVWRGGVGIEQHVRAARAVLDAGGVFVQMPEGTVSGPPGRVGPFRAGAAVIALRMSAPIVPLAIAGTDELYIGRRMASRILPATSIGELLGTGWDGVLPAADTREEIELARQLGAAVAARLGPVVEELQAWADDPPDRRRPLRRWLTWLLLGRGRLDRRAGNPPAS